MVCHDSGVLNVSITAKVKTILSFHYFEKIFNTQNLNNLIQSSSLTSNELFYRDLLSLPTLSLLGCFLILCHYFKKMEPVTMIESRLDLHTLTNRTPSSLSPPSSSASRSVNSKKGRKSPVPKLLSEMELKSQNWGWIDWLWWTAFNGSIGKLLYVY